VVSALDLSPGNRTAARHVDHVADNRAGRSMQAVSRNRHRCELLPAVCLRIIGLVGAEDLTGCLSAKNDNLAADIDA